MDNELEKLESPVKFPRRKARTTSRRTEVSQTEPEVVETPQEEPSLQEVPVAEKPAPAPSPAVDPDTTPEPEPGPAPARVKKRKTILPSIPTGVSNRGMRNRI